MTCSTLANGTRRNDNEASLLSETRIEQTRELNAGRREDNGYVLIST